MKDNSLCILIRHAPYSQVHAAEALRHAGGALAEGIAVSLLLSGDGVHVARDGQNVSDSGFTALSPVLPTLLAKGVSKKELERVHSPIGVDIGSETPEEIAVSIVAQLIGERARQPA